MESTELCWQSLRQPGDARNTGNAPTRVIKCRHVGTCAAQITATLAKSAPPVRALASSHARTLPAKSLARRRARRVCRRACGNAHTKARARPCVASHVPGCPATGVARGRYHANTGVRVCAVNHARRPLVCACFVKARVRTCSISGSTL
jgi:hypothetical protein